MSNRVIVHSDVVEQTKPALINYVAAIFAYVLSLDSLLYTSLDPNQTPILQSDRIIPLRLRFRCHQFRHFDLVHPISRLL